MFGKPGKGNIIRHSFVKLKHGRRRRYRCTICGKTFCSTTGTPYYRLQCSRSAFDQVATLSVRRLTFRDVFTAVAGFVSFVVALIRVRWRRQELALRLAVAH